MSGLMSGGWETGDCHSVSHRAHPRLPDKEVDALCTRANISAPVRVLLLVVQSPLMAQYYLEFLQRPILERDEARFMMYSYVDRNMPPIRLPDNKAAWEAARPQVVAEIRRLVGLDEVERRGPLKWTSKGRIDRETYTIERLLFESYPGMMVPALVYTPKRLRHPRPLW